MVINIIICVAAIILLFKGITLVLRTVMVWMMFVSIMKNSGTKMHGRVVEVETKTYGSDDGAITANCPIVEYKSDEEKEMHRRIATYDFIVETANYSQKLYSQKTSHVGDKVTVICNPKTPDNILAFSTMPLTRLLCKLFVPGCIYVAASVLGICYVFVK